MSVKYIFKTVKIVVVVLFVIIFTRSLIVEPGVVNGRSMEPNYIDNNLFIINKFSLLIRKPVRGDVVQVVFSEEGEFVIKRIIGVPGDTVVIKNNRVYIQKDASEPALLDEPYLKDRTITRSVTKDATAYDRLGDDEYFVLGDNRGDSKDSRIYGAVSRSQINGLVAYVFSSNK